MADPVDLSLLTTLYTERTSIEAALDNFDAGGTITSMVVGGPPMPPPPTPPEPGTPPIPPEMPVLRTPVMVSTINMTYPQQMVDAVKGQLTARRDAINADIQTVLSGGTPHGTPTAAASSPSSRRERPRT
jgi:hypothetical protein